MKRLLLLFTILLIPARSTEYDDFSERLVSHVKALNSFVLDYLGCSPNLVTNTSGVPQNCENAGSFDVKKFNAAKKSAEKLFDLVPAP